MTSPRQCGVLRYQFRQLFRELGRPFTSGEFGRRFPVAGRDPSHTLSVCRRGGQVAVVQREELSSGQVRYHYVPVLLPGMDEDR